MASFFIFLANQGREHLKAINSLAQQFYESIAKGIKNEGARQFFLALAGFEKILG